MRKRWVLGLICLLLCLLPACGQEKPAANDVPPASESPVEAAPATSLPRRRTAIPRPRRAKTAGVGNWATRSRLQGLAKHR